MASTTVTTPQRADVVSAQQYAWKPIVSAMAGLGLLLSVVSNAYGFEVDELYFRMLSPAWGYVDQPPLTPVLGWLAAQVSPSPWVMRIPATVLAMASVLVVAALIREFGGDRRAQTWGAWAYAFSGSVMAIGHILVTATADLVTWPAVCLFVIRAIRRRESRWWPVAGLVVGASTYNKLLIGLLVVALVVGLLINGPRRALCNRWCATGAVIAVVIALPNLVYQSTHGWPQLSMIEALSEEHGAGDGRLTMWPFLLMLLGPALLPVWVAGLVALARRPEFVALRFLTTAFAALLLEVFIGGGQLYYPLGMVVVMFAAGTIPTVEFLSRSWQRRTGAAGVVAFFGVVSALLVLPLLPAGFVARTPIPAINEATRDQVGWPDYVAGVAGVYRAIPPREAAHTVIVTTNYGEAGAIVGYGSVYGLPHPYSGHNQLYDDRRPPADTDTVVLVGAQADDRDITDLFADCAVRARLHNRYGLANVEENAPVSVCHTPHLPWTDLWPHFRHYG